MKIKATFDTSILTPVAVVTKEPTTAVIPCAKFMTEFQKKGMSPSLLDLSDSKEKKA